MATSIPTQLRPKGPAASTTPRRRTRPTQRQQIVTPLPHPLEIGRRTTPPPKANVKLRADTTLPDLGRALTVRAEALTKSATQDLGYLLTRNPADIASQVEASAVDTHPCSPLFSRQAGPLWRNDAKQAARAFISDFKHLHLSRHSRAIALMNLMRMNGVRLEHLKADPELRQLISVKETDLDVLRRTMGVDGFNPFTREAVKDRIEAQWRVLEDFAIEEESSMPRAVKGFATFVAQYHEETRSWPSARDIHVEWLTQARTTYFKPGDHRTIQHALRSYYEQMSRVLKAWQRKGIDIQPLSKEGLLSITTHAHRAPDTSKYIDVLPEVMAAVLDRLVEEAELRHIGLQVQVINPYAGNAEILAALDRPDRLVVRHRREDRETVEQILLLLFQHHRYAFGGAKVGPWFTEPVRAAGLRLNGMYEIDEPLVLASLSGGIVHQFLYAKLLETAMQKALAERLTNPQDDLFRYIMLKTIQEWLPLFGYHPNRTARNVPLNPDDAAVMNRFAAFWIPKFSRLTLGEAWEQYASQAGLSQDYRDSVQL